MSDQSVVTLSLPEGEAGELSVTRRAAFEALDRLHQDEGGRCLTCAAWSPCRTRKLIAALKVDALIYGSGNTCSDHPPRRHGHHHGELPGQVDLYELLAEVS